MDLVVFEGFGFVRCRSRVFLVIDELVCGFSFYFLYFRMVWIFSEVFWRVRFLRRIFGLERVLDLVEWFFFINIE